ncbi:MAG: class I SAM-dependent methyltransferase [Planctomycetes bacterium]|nr:class I SAM-dependent methyltransferase [Planctomycetota bacterium]
MANSAHSSDPCDICLAGEPFLPFLEVSLSGILDVNVLRCHRCGFRQVRPRLSRQELASLYPSEYFDSASEVGFRDYARQQQRCERDAYFLARRLRRLSPSGCLLDVGCALGFLIEALQRFSPWTAVGIDVSPFAVFFARKRYGLDARCATLDEARFPDQSFDFIVQKDLLEHVPNPRKHLLESHRILKPGGHLWLVTPNGEANLRPLVKLARSLQDPDSPSLPLLEQGHLSFFSSDHLLRLFADCGFECVRMRNINLRRGLRALGYLPRRRRGPPLAPRGHPRNADAAGPASTYAAPAALREDDPRTLRLYEQVCREIEIERSALRRSRPYYYFRHALRALAALPAPFHWGNDFEFLLRKR